LLLGLLAEAIGLQLADFRSRRGKLLFELFIPLDGRRVLTLPVSGIATQFRNLATEAGDLLSQLSHDVQQVGVGANTRFQQHRIHDAAQ
jgi:hypothetical protein